MSPEEFDRHVIGAMTQWAAGYTDPDEKGEQYRVRWVGTADDGAELFTVEPGPYVPGNLQTFSVAVTVTEVPR